MIFYFSGTGNTKWVVRQIADAIGEELLYIPDLIRKGQYEYEVRVGERIGFCFPTHGWQPPGIVREFIRKLRMKRPKDTFCWEISLTIRLKCISTSAFFKSSVYQCFLSLSMVNTDRQKSAKDSESFSCWKADHNL